MKELANHGRSHVDLTGLKCLVVAENKLARDFVKSALQPYGICRIAEVGDVGAATAFVREHMPDLAILDTDRRFQPSVDFTLAIRRGGRAPLDELAIIIASDDTNRETVMAAIQAGANGFIAKPFTAQALYKRVWTIFNAPQNFIRSATYIGPDRRAASLGPPEGGDRRKG